MLIDLVKIFCKADEIKYTENLLEETLMMKNRIGSVGGGWGTPQSERERELAQP